MKDEFFSLAAHELRTPITVIKAQAQLAERFHAQGRLQGEVITKTLRTFVQESDRLARLCSDLLDVARLDGDCFEVYLSEFDLAELLSTVVARHASRDSEHSFSVEAVGPVLVRADRERVQHVLANIVGNAVRYSPQGGEIRLSIEARARRVAITVRDNGMGIPPDKIRYIFRRYYRAHQRGLKGPAGLGLGLYVSRESLRRMNGTISVKSAGVGRGTTVTVTLPKSQECKESYVVE